MSSIQSGQQFHMNASGLDDTSPSSYGGIAGRGGVGMGGAPGYPNNIGGVSLGGPLFANSLTSSHYGNSFSAASSTVGPPHIASPRDVQIYCAGCHRLSALSASYACTECICGLCHDCVDALSLEQSRGRLATCPKCKAFGGRFKMFQLEIGAVGPGAGIPTTTGPGGPVGSLQYTRAGI